MRNLLHRGSIRTLLCLCAFIFPYALQAERVSDLVYPVLDYPASSADLWATLADRISIAPFNLFALGIFVLAIIHTLSYRKFLSLSKKFALSGQCDPNKTSASCMLSRLFHLFGEVEIIFALWLIPLFIGFWITYGWGSLTAYLDWLTFDKQKYVEPIFVVFIMCVSATRPVIQLSSDIINLFTRALVRIGASEARAWWMSILCIGPLLGSFITEPAAITICALLVARRVFDLEPSSKFKYATLGLLLVSISAGGTLTHFSAPPVLMVAGVWGWDTPFMFFNFGLKAGLAITVSTFVVMAMLRKDFASLAQKDQVAASNSKDARRAPAWIVAVHIMTLAGIVLSLHHPALMIFIFLAFAGFVEITQSHDDGLGFKSPVLVGLFLAALVTHGSLQAWWIEPLLKSFNGAELFAGSVILTAFNDNAAITYLATLVPDFGDEMKYMIVAGAVAGGGLTVIANAPNPAGVSILGKYFKGGVSPVRLFVWAIVPTAIVSIFFLAL